MNETKLIGTILKWSRIMKKWKPRKGTIKLCILSAVLLTVIIWTIWGNTALMVNTVTVTAGRIPAAFSGFRIVQVSDLHNAEFGESNVRLLELLSESGPDIIVPLMV